MDWISIKDALPDNSLPVLIYYLDETPNDYNSMQTARLYDGKLGEDVQRLIWSCADGENSYKATHWMPLPEKPKI